MNAIDKSPHEVAHERYRITRKMMPLTTARLDIARDRVEHFNVALAAARFTLRFARCSVCHGGSPRSRISPEQRCGTVRNAHMCIGSQGEEDDSTGHRSLTLRIREVTARITETAAARP